MAQFTKNNKRNPLERHSSQGLVLGCPICAAKLDLLDTRDGDQAYWCHRCQSGWRVGNLPEAAHRSKDKQNAPLEPPVEIPAPVAARVTPKARAAKDGLGGQSQRQLAALAPLTRLRRYRAQGEAKGLTAARVDEIKAPRAKAKPPVPQIVAPKRSGSPRAAEVTVSTPTKKAAKKPVVETSLKGSRKSAQIVVPAPKPVKAKRQPLEVAVSPSRASPQKAQKRALEVAALAPRPKRSARLPLEIAVSAPQPKRRQRSALETAAPIKAIAQRTKRSQLEQPVLVTSGKGSRKPAAPAPKVATGKRQRLEVAAKPKVSAQTNPQKPRTKRLETAAPIKAPAKPSRREKPALETVRGARKPVQVAAPSPRAANGKRQPLEVAAKPKISATRVAPQKPPKKTLETVSVSGKKARQAVIEPTPKPRRTSPRAAEALKPTRVVPEQRKSRDAPISKALNAPIRKVQNAPIGKVKPEPVRTAQTAPTRKVQTASVSQARAQRPTAPLESKSRRAAPQPTPAPVKALKPKASKPEPTRAARAAKQPAPVAARPKPARSSPARSAPVAPSNPVQFGLFDALPAKTTARRSAK